MNNENQNNINIDYGKEQSRTGTVSSILNARDAYQSKLNSMATSLVGEGYNSLDYISKQYELVLKSLDMIQDKNKEQKRVYDDISKQLDKIRQTQEKINGITENGNTNAEELLSLSKDVTDITADQGVLLAQNNKLMALASRSKEKEIKQAERSLYLAKQQAEIQKKSNVELTKELKTLEKESKINLGQAWDNGLRKLSTTLRDIKKTFDLSDLHDKVNKEQSVKTQLQNQLQIAYGLDKKGFRQLKRNINSSVDTSVYTSDQIFKAMSQLQEIGVGTQEQAEKYFPTILKGQQLLGLSASTQQQLLTLGNRTGRNTLEFMNNKVAQYMKTATNLGKEQLNQLVSINAQTATGMLDYGVDSQEFQDMLNDTTVALSNINQDNGRMAGLYNSMIGNIQSASTEQNAYLYGSDHNSLRERLNAGESLFDIIKTSNGVLNNLYNKYKSGGISDFTTAYQEMGIDSTSASIIKQLADMENKYGMSMNQIVAQYKTSNTSSEELNAIEKSVRDSTGWVAKTAHSISNWLQQEFDWSDMDIIKTDLNIIIALLSAMEIGSLIKDLSGLGKGLFGKSGLLSKLGSGSRLLGAGKLLPLAAGAVWAGADLIGGFTSLSNDLYGNNASFGQRAAGGLMGFFSGSTVHKNAEGKVSTGSNIGMGALSGAAKGALIGAGLGSIIPGLGTGIGGLAGAAIGGIGGALTGWWKSSEAKKQEETLENIEKNTSTSAESLQNLGRTYLIEPNYRSLATLKQLNQGGPAGTPVPYSNSFGIGGPSDRTYNFPWHVTGGYPYYDSGTNSKWHTKHSGLDFGVPIGTKVGAAFGGSVYKVQYDNRNTYDGGNGYVDGGNYIIIKGDDGTLYKYYHLSENLVKQGDRVSAGQLIGLSGNTGYSTGPHLHFGVYKNGTQDPVNYLSYNSPLFNAGKLVAEATAYSDTSAVEEASDPAFYTTKFSTLKTGIGGSGMIVESITDLKQTIIDLSNRTTQNENIIRMLAGKTRPDPLM